MGYTAEQPSPPIVGNFKSRAKDLVDERASREISLRVWADERLTSVDIEEFDSLFEAYAEKQAKLFELSLDNSRWWMWMFARLYLEHYGHHMEEFQQYPSEASRPIVNGNIYDIRELLRRKS